jgi:hypothetical protein
VSPAGRDTQSSGLDADSDPSSVTGEHVCTHEISGPDNQGMLKKRQRLCHNLLMFSINNYIFSAASEDKDFEEA